MFKKLINRYTIFSILLYGISIFAYSAENTYQLLWSKKFAFPFDYQWIDEMYPSDKSNLIVFKQKGRLNKYLIAFDKTTGKQVYKNDTDDYIYPHSLILGDKILSFSETSDYKIIVILRTLQDTKLIKRIETSVEAHGLVEYKAYLVGNDIYLNFTGNKILKIEDVNSSAPHITYLEFKLPEVSTQVDRLFLGSDNKFYYVNFPEKNTRELRQLDLNGNTLWKQSEKFEGNWYWEKPRLKIRDHKVIIFQNVDDDDNHTTHFITTVDSNDGTTLSTYKQSINKDEYNSKLFHAFDSQGNLIQLRKNCELTKFKNSLDGYNQILWFKQLSTQQQCAYYCAITNKNGSILFLQNHEHQQFTLYNMENGEEMGEKIPDSTKYHDKELHDDILIANLPNGINFIDATTGKIIVTIPTPEQIHRFRYHGSSIELYSENHIYFYALKLK